MAAKNTSESSQVTFIEEKNPENIQVCVRMRPLLEPYEDELAWEVDNENCSIRTRSDLKSVADSNKIKALSASGSRYYNELLHQQIFTFDNVQGPDVKTRDIYNKLCKRLVVSVLQGYNGTIFMYGQTTSGKTYSMLGTTKDPGILPYSMRTIFQEINKPECESYGISISYLEIYNETINDLLVPGSTGLKIIDDPKYGVIVKGLKRQKVKTFEEAIYLMNFGEEHRMYRETNFHEHSSRSHTIFQVFIESSNQNDKEKRHRYSCLNLVDLAGSERLGDNDHNDAQVEETGHINKSLFLLTNLIKKLAEEKASHIPYRDSKLTRILSNALGGNSLTTIVCTVSPALMNYNQTLSTLRFASRAKKITNKPTINEIDDAEVHHQLKQEIKYLLERLHQSENEIMKVNTINTKLEDSLQTTKQEIVNLQKDFEELKAIFVKESFKQQTEENQSTTSVLDLSDAGSNSKSKLKKGVSSEFFFGDPLINYIEQAFNESSMLSPGSDISSNEMNNFKDWSIQSLKAKYGYLKELKLVQQKYAESLLGETFRYLNKSKQTTVQQYAKSYLHNELGKNDIISARIWEALKRFDTDAESVTNESKDDKAYGQIIQRIEKKYDEVSKMTTPASKSRTNSQTNLNATPEVKQFSESGEKNIKPLQKQNYYSEDFMQRSPDSPKIEVRGEKLKFESPGGSGIPTPKLDSLMKTRVINAFATQRQINGTAYVFGVGKDGRLGDGTYDNNKQPQAIQSLKFNQVACGHHNTFGIAQDKLLYAWGRNEIGELGTGDFKNTVIPLNLSDLNHVKIESIACGFQHTIALSTLGKVFSWGCGDDGQLGHGDNFSKHVPSEIKYLERLKIQSIACGHSQSAAYTSDNALYTWGNNADYRIMNTNGKNLTIPALTELQKLRLTSENPSNFDLISFSLGVDHMCVVTREGKVYSAGRGNEGQLGRELLKSQDKISAFKLSPKKEELEILSYPLCEVDLFGKTIKAMTVACGEKYTLVLSNKNKIYGFGDASEGCLAMEGLNGTNHVRTPTEISSLSDLRIISIAAGPKSAACISNEGEVYCWGANFYQQIGQESDKKTNHLPKKIENLEESRAISVSCGILHTAILVN